ncbi:hypothetical protein LguiA_030531 [Lonicera macranthoides]
MPRVRFSADFLAKAIVEYASLRSKASESNDEPAAATNTDPRLEVVVKMMVDKYVLQLLVKAFQKLPSPNCLNICQCILFFDEPEGVAVILEKPICSDKKDDALLALQIAFYLKRTGSNPSGRQRACRLNLRKLKCNNYNKVSIGVQVAMQVSVEEVESLSVSKSLELGFDVVLEGELNERGFIGLRKTKLVCTIGLVCSSLEDLEKLALGGMNMAKLNVL